jgi:predicted transcriptional regulator
MTKRAFGELESQILFILKSGERMTVKDVHRCLGGHDNYNSVMTVMSRLAEKKKLGRERVGLQYEYWNLAPTNSATFLDKLKQTFFGVKTSTLVSHLIESADDLTDNDLDEMEKMILKAKAAKK